MNIKEAGRYSNYLQTLLFKLSYVVDSVPNQVKISENHLKSKANPTEQDEVIEQEAEKPFTCKVSDLIFLQESIITEKLLLAIAIDNAKKDLTIDWKESNISLTLDAAIEFNKKQRNFAESTLLSLIAQKPSKKITKQTGYKMNNEGDQVSYYYNVERTLTLDYNKDVVRSMYKSILTKCEKISSLIEEAQLKDSIAFTPAFDLHDSVEDVIENFEKTLANKEA